MINFIIGMLVLVLWVGLVLVATTNLVWKIPVVRDLAQKIQERALGERD